MNLGKLLRGASVAAAVLMGLQLDAAADPVTYEGTLTSGVPGAGDLPGSSVNSENEALEADYWRFWATAGDNVTVVTERVDIDLDPSHWVYVGLFADTTDPLLAGADNLFDATASFIDFGDDEIANPGPFGDAQTVFVAPATGWYTVAVTNFLSGPVPNDGDYDYEVTVRGNTGSPVPEPTFLALLACGACGVFVSRRRKSA
jgi:hypothetical protein